MGIMGRIVRFGNSVAIAISKKDMKERGWKLNQHLELEENVLRKQEAIERAFGSARGAKPFVREKKDRVF